MFVIEYDFHDWRCLRDIQCDILGHSRFRYCLKGKRKAGFFSQFPLGRPLGCLAWKSGA
jgi:hypothetical protein